MVASSVPAQTGGFRVPRHEVANADGVGDLRIHQRLQLCGHELPRELARRLLLERTGYDLLLFGRPLFLPFARAMFCRPAIGFARSDGGPGAM